MSKYPKLPKAFKRKWVAALRSGKFNQCHANLYNTFQDAYCCMGVAGSVLKVPKRTMARFGFFIEGKSTNFEKVPKALFSSQRSKLPEKLAELNDTKDWSFERIADWIEKNL